MGFINCRMFFINRTCKIQYMWLRASIREELNFKCDRILARVRNQTDLNAFFL